MAKTKTAVPEFVSDSISQQQQIKDYLKGVFSEEVYNTWIEFFDIEKIGPKKIIIGYYGDASLKKFKKAYGEMVQIHICSAIGCVKKVKICKRKLKKEKNVSGKTRKNIRVAKLFGVSMVFAAIALVIAIFGANYVTNFNFRVSFYNVSSLKIDNKIRVIQISDFHAKSYGSENSKLTDRVRKLKPDIILLTGDIIESDELSVEPVVKLCKTLVDIAPTFFVYGNNEVEKYYDIPLNQTELDAKFGFKDDTRDPSKLTEMTEELETKLEATGVKVLKNEYSTLTVGTTEVDVFGVLTSNPSSFWSYAGDAFNDFVWNNAERLKITAIHEPFVFNEFEPETWGDLAVCGHTHGGTVKVPVLGPLYTHEGGIFPTRKGHCVYGRYDVCGTPLVVSSGLDNNLLRINNQPELVIIDINKF